MTGLALFGDTLASLGLAGGPAGGTRDGEPRAAPEAAPEVESVEAGLAAFAAKWNGAGPVLAATRFGRFVVHKTFNCHVAGTPRAWSLTLGPTGASLSPGRDPTAHAEAALAEEDWEAVLGGDFTGLAPVLGGRTRPSKDDANSVVTLLLVMYVLAHLPAEVGGDPRFTEELLEGFFQRGGLPDCQGAPPSLGALERAREDPGGTARETVMAPQDVPPVTRQLSDWVAGLSYGDVPQAQVAAAKHQIKSILGATYAGNVTEPAANLRDEVAAWEEPGAATVLGETTFQTSPRAAALANSFLSQALEWEDWTYLAHSGAAVVPAALAAAEHAAAEGEDVGGKELLTAVAAGNEILARFGGVMTDILHSGQAVPLHQIELPLVAGSLMGLDADGLQDAAGVAATQPQLTSLPSWTAGGKGMITAEPAETSVRAAQLAAAGVSGRGDQLENPLGYMYRVSDVRDPRDLEAAMEGLGSRWRFREATYFDKRYPCDGFTLTAVHATLQVRRKLVEEGVDPSDPAAIESIRVHQNLPMASTATMFSEGREKLLDRVLDPDQPGWTYTALLFDGRYPILAALLHGELGHGQYKEAAIADGRVRTLWDRVYGAPDLSMGVFGAEVSVTPSGGSTVRARVGAREGTGSTVGCIQEDVNEGFSPQDKLEAAAGPVRSDGDLEAIGAAVDELETYDDVRSFTALL